jgi:hypothetical protein
MLPDAWSEPTIDWLGTLDVHAVSAHIAASADRIGSWPVTEFDRTPTDLFREGDRIWIWQPDAGAVRFPLDEPRISAWEWPGGDRSWFRQLVTRSWIPAIYPLWGRQVLHASAAMCTATGDAVAFTGPTHAGKSTTAYGVARRSGWRLIADDTVAFSLADSRAILHPIAQDARLRPESAAFFGESEDDAGVSREVVWPGSQPSLRTIYVLDPADEPAPPVLIPLSSSEALPLLLQQAYALSFAIPKYNQALVKDYLALAASVPAFRLRYRRSFDAAEALFAAVDRHASERGRVSGPVA